MKIFKEISRANNHLYVIHRIFLIIGAFNTSKVITTNFTALCPPPRNYLKKRKKLVNFFIFSFEWIHSQSP